GRLVAPDWPGLYWLQWDMVEEGATWFGQVAPRQVRTLVIVFPTATWIAGPLPFAIALLGLLAVRRQRLGTATGLVAVVAPIADALWCEAALAAKPFLVISDALLEPTRASYWLIAAAALLPPTL